MTLRASPVLGSSSSSSRAWLARHARDPYVKQRLPASYRSRAAFKLLELDRDWGGGFLSKGRPRAVVDLGAAPGGWSQVVAEKLGWVGRAPDDGAWSSTAGRGVVVALDLLPVAPIPGVHSLQIDFLSPRAAAAVKAALTTPENPSGMADIILSDIAANSTGNKVRDVAMSLDVCRSVFEFAKDNLHVGGTLLLKHFAHPLSQQFRKDCLEPNFHLVHYIKPSASRVHSSEGYWLCRRWKGFTTIVQV